MLQQLWSSLRAKFAPWLTRRGFLSVRILDGAAGCLIVQLPCELVVFQLNCISHDKCKVVCDMSTDRWPERQKPVDLGSLTLLNRSHAILRVKLQSGCSRYTEFAIADACTVMGGKYVHDCAAFARSANVERFQFVLERA